MISGVIPVAPTTFDEDETLDLARQARVADFLRCGHRLRPPSERRRCARDRGERRRGRWTGRRPLRQAASRVAATAMRIVSQPTTTAAVARANPRSPVRWI